MSIEERLARLEAESEIRKLKARYLNACDAKDVAAVRACFTEDPKIDFTGMGQFTLDQLIGIFTELAVTTQIADSHHGHNAEIEVLSADSAKARWNLGFSTFDPRGNSFRVMSMFYYDEYRRTSDGWRISVSCTEARTVVEGRLEAGSVTGALLVPPPAPAA
ncbi:hypothetical protein OB03_01175 [Brevundimonas sp. GN22]